MNLRQPLWMIAFGHLLGVLCILAGIGLVAAGWESWQWLLWWPVFHVIGSLVTSVGLHRYFSHAAFKTSRLWHNAMALYTPMLLIGSPIDWSVTHIAHHVHADTKNDPHIADWTYLVWKRYRKPIVHRRQLRRLMGDPTLAFVHRYGAGLWILAMLAIVAFLPWQFFVFGYGMALGSVHLIGAMP